MAQRDLAAVLDNWHADAEVLRRHSQHALADQLDKCVSSVRVAAEEWLTMLPEMDASLYTGETVRWLQSRFPALERRGMADKVGKTRRYRQCALTRRASTAAAFDAGRAAARGGN
jgi:hypothetical protein